MVYVVEFLKTAEEELARLPKDAQRNIVRRVEGLKDNPRPPGVERLKGAEKLFRLRVGDCRVVYTVESRHLVVLIVRIGHRKEVYENLKVLESRVLVWRQQKKLFRLVSEHKRGAFNDTDQDEDDSRPRGAHPARANHEGRAGWQGVLVEKSGVPMVAIISADDFRRVIAERETRFEAIDRIRRRLPPVPDVEIEQDVRVALKQVRRRRRA